MKFQDTFEEAKKAPSSSAIALLREMGIPFKVFTHTQPPQSLEQAAIERGQNPGQIIRSILFRKSVDEFVLVLVCGPSQISWKNLRQYLNQSRLSMASDAEVLAQTGFVPGSVTPIGLISPIRTLVDRNLLHLDEVSIGSGIKGTAIILTPESLLNALDRYEFIDVVKDD
jgi:Cys-tRNA(Pro)/Cys-tRNA(Cys) deacylase